MKKKTLPVFSYDVDAVDYHTEDLQVEKGVWQWNMICPNDRIDQLSLTMPGRHNVQNAVAACGLAMKIGSEKKKIQAALPGYKGVSRRFEIRYKDADHVLIDDYAHHPEELKAAILAARETYGGPVTGVFQPHLYTRTRDLAKEFAEALDLLDYPVVISIYPAREEPIEGVSSQMILDHMHNKNKVLCEGDTWVEWIIRHQPKVLVTLGAGDLDKHIPELIRKLYKNENNK